MMKRLLDISAMGAFALIVSCGGPATAPIGGTGGGVQGGAIGGAHGTTGGAIGSGGLAGGTGGGTGGQAGATTSAGSGGMVATGGAGGSTTTAIADGGTAGIARDGSAGTGGSPATGGGPAGGGGVATGGTAGTAASGGSGGSADAPRLDGADARLDTGDATGASDASDAAIASDVRDVAADVDARLSFPDGAPFIVKAGLYDQSKAETLGLAGPAAMETTTIFRPSASSDHYSNGVVMVGFQGWLYAQWQSSATDEDASDTWVAYSRSQDGKTWTQPMALAPRWDQGIRTSGGFHVSGDTLVAYINVWPASTSPRGGYTEYTTSTDGLAWTARKRLPMADGTTLDGIFEQDPHALPDGRILSAAHFQPGLLVAPCYTDDPSGTGGWKRAAFSPLAHTGTSTRELEPSWFRRADGAAIMVFRDQSSSYRRLASISFDRGATWTTAVESDMPDAREKQSAGNLPDGTAFQVGSPVAASTRLPLVVTLSRAGYLFDTAFVLRKGGSDLQALRYAGKAKSAGYHYPKSMVWNGALYVAYATNKEDVEYTRVPVGSLTY